MPWPRRAGVANRGSGSSLSAPSAPDPCCRTAGRPGNTGRNCSPDKSRHPPGRRSGRDGNRGSRDWCTRKTKAGPKPPGCSKGLPQEDKSVHSSVVLGRDTAMSGPAASRIDPKYMKIRPQDQNPPAAAGFSFISAAYLLFLYDGPGESPAVRSVMTNKNEPYYARQRKRAVRSPQ